MRKFNLNMPFLLLCFIQLTFAQLHVSTNSYVFNKGALVFVNQGVNLQNNGNIYLRNEGQLLQGTTAASTNTGLGKVSVFQEGTVNNYAYNYWCSPVGNASAASGNEDFGITMLNVPTTNISSNPATMISTSYNGLSSAGSLTIATYWVWRFLSSTNYFSWLQSGATSNIAAGQGFTMKGTIGTDATDVGEVAVNNPGSAQRYDFRGKPNDGSITINVGLNNFTLTGNPYASAIDLNSFLNDPLNSNIDGTALFWEHDKTVNSHDIALYRGGYGVYNGATSIYTPATFYTYDLAGNQGSVFSNPLNNYERRFSPIGQGFMVRGDANGSVQMRNSYRVFVKEGILTNSQFEKGSNNNNATVNYGFFDEIPNLAGTDYTQISKAPTPHFIVNTSLNGQAVRQISIGFLPTAIDGVDRADSKFPVENASIVTDMYLVLNSLPYVHSTTSFDINKRFPIGFKNTNSGNATYTLKVNEFVNFDVENVYLYDNVTGIYHDIKNNFHEVTLPTGSHNNRFEITFKNESLQVDGNVKDNFVIVQNNSNQLLSISNPSSLDLKSVVFFDMAGKLIFDKIDLGARTNYEFSTSSLSDGVYIVKLQTTDNKVLSQKIIVEKVK